MNPTDIAGLLPDVVRRTCTPGSPIEQTLGTMADLHLPVEQLLADFDRYVDPYRCPVGFVAYLAEWVGLDWLVGAGDDGTGFPCGDGPLRDLIASADDLAKQRGTADALRRMLELATGCAGFDVAIAERPAFHIVATCPESTRAYQDLVTLIIRHEKPAFATADVAFGDHRPQRLGSTSGPNTTREPHA